MKMPQLGHGRIKDTTPHDDAYRRWRMCGRKKAFDTQRKANKTASKIGNIVYECPYCFCWHTARKR